MNHPVSDRTREIVGTLRRGTDWIHNSITLKNKQVKPELISQYLASGWVLGRSNKDWGKFVNHKRWHVLRNVHKDTCIYCGGDNA